MTILARVDNIHSRTLLHSRHPSAHVITGSFTVNYQEEANLRITLNIPDEEKVEYFEVESPGGETQILSKFEDGMVYFTFAGLLENGLWTYRAKIYTDTIIDKDDFVAVDAVLSTHDKAIDITSEVFVSESEPKKVYARLQQGHFGVAGANVTGVILLPDNTQLRIQLYDNGLGYPDITKNDGVYSGYLPRLATKAGYYSFLINSQSSHNATVIGGI